jgi:hypothetical protein
VGILSSYDFVIEYLEGKKNPVDGPPRRPNYEKGYERATTRLLATFAGTTVEPYNDLLQEIKTAQPIDALAAERKHRIFDTPLFDIPDLRRIDELEEESGNEWKVTTGVLTYAGRMYVPLDNLLRNNVISVFHHNPESDHFRALKTAELVSRDFHCPARDATVRKYIAGCKLCPRIKALLHAHHGTNMPLAPPSRPREGVTMDFVTDLPESTASGYMGILVIIDRLT